MPAAVLQAPAVESCRSFGARTPVLHLCGPPSARTHAPPAPSRPPAGNFNTVAIECLQKLNNPESKFTIACDRHTFNYLVHNGFSEWLQLAPAGWTRVRCVQAPFMHKHTRTHARARKRTRKHVLTLDTTSARAAYLVVADEAYGRQVPFAFLERVKAEFEEGYAEKGRLSPAHSMDRSFGSAPGWGGGAAGRAPRLHSVLVLCTQHPARAWAGAV